jgi:hypothetical protein
MSLAGLSPVANHLWQSTLFVAVVCLLTFLLRSNRAPVRHWLWLAASMINRGATDAGLEDGQGQCAVDLPRIINLE